VASRTVTRKVRRPSRERKLPQASPDPAALITDPISQTASRSGDLILLPSNGFVRSDGRLTYLRTARLRL
jgi:hypothetical protein